MRHGGVTRFRTAVRAGLCLPFCCTLSHLLHWMKGRKQENLHRILAWRPGQACCFTDLAQAPGSLEEGPFTSPVPN